MLDGKTARKIDASRWRTTAGGRGRRRVPHPARGDPEAIDDRRRQPRLRSRRPWGSKRRLDPRSQRRSARWQAGRMMSGGKSTITGARRPVRGLPESKGGTDDDQGRRGRLSRRAARAARRSRHERRPADRAWHGRRTGRRPAAPCGTIIDRGRGRRLAGSRIDRGHAIAIGGEAAATARLPDGPRHDGAGRRPDASSAESWSTAATIAPRPARFSADTWPGKRRSWRNSSAGPLRRLAGDLAALGKGEILLPTPLRRRDDVTRSVHSRKARSRLIAFVRYGTLALSMRAESTSRPDVSAP